MKLYITNEFTRDLSRFTDDELKSFGIYDRSAASAPINIDDIAIGKNARGLLVVSILTPNHKYLNINYSMSTNAVGGAERSAWFSRGFQIQTHDEVPYSDEDPFMVPVSSLDLWLTPESDEEDESINGVAAALACKWQYDITIVPYKDFDSRKLDTITPEHL